MGFESFIWWVGVVEDRRDPMKLGRLRTRVLGMHTEDKQLIPTCELHWAYVYQPAPWNPAMNGLGHSPMGPVEGTWVYGFMRDSNAAQDLIVFGTIHGIPEDPPKPCEGFYDPSLPFHELPSAPRKIRKRFYPNDGTGAQLTPESIPDLYPRQKHPWGAIVGENDINRLAIVEKVDDTIIGVRKRQRDNGRPKEFNAIPIAFVHTQPEFKWVEPKTTYDAKYPYNHVYESESGHIVEFDDTPGKERIHLYHRSGTFVEIFGDPGKEGDMVLKVVGKTAAHFMEDLRIHAQNVASITIDGETRIYVRNNCKLQVDGNLEVDVGKDYIERVKGNKYVHVEGNNIEKIKGNDEHHSGGSMKHIAGGTIKESAGGSFVMTSGGTLSGDAPSIHWNSGKGSGEGPQAPVVPPFPAVTKWVEYINESFSDPEPEEKPDPNPPMCDQKDC